MKLTTRLRNFSDGNRGVIATEFALILPMLVLLWVGVVELATAHLVFLRVEMAAQSAADIIAQDKITDETKLANVDAAIKTILYPYATVNLGYRIASVVADPDGIKSVSWEKQGGSGVTIDPGTGNDLTTTSDSVIVVTVTYKHTPVLADRIIGKSIFGDSITLSETVFAKPRLVPIILCTDCAP